MTEPVAIHDGYYIIQASSWLAQRTGAAQSELSDTLREFARCDVFSEYWPQMDTAARMQLFAAARGWHHISAISLRTTSSTHRSTLRPARDTPPSSLAVHWSTAATESSPSVVTAP